MFLFQEIQQFQASIAADTAGRKFKKVPNTNVAHAKAVLENSDEVNGNAIN